MRAKIELLPHDRSWANVAISEAKKLGKALGDNLLDVQHIGSTAIPGLKAKPTIDLMPRVRSLVALDAKSDAIRALGYQWRGEFGIPGRRYYTRNDPATGQRLFNVHAYQHDSAEIDRHIAFRDYLRSHADEARAYEAEKERAAALHPDDTVAYNDAKSAWITACEQRALAWWSGRTVTAERTYFAPRVQGASAVRVQASLLLTVPPVLGDLRRSLDPTMAARIPPHVTVIYDDEAPTPDLMIHRLYEVCGKLPPIKFHFDQIVGFERPNEGLYVATDASASFVELRSQVLRPPFAPRATRPHVTVLHPRSVAACPVDWRPCIGTTIDWSTTVHEVTVIESDGGPWRVRKTIPLAYANC